MLYLLNGQFSEVAWSVFSCLLFGTFVMFIVALLLIPNFSTAVWVFFTIVSIEVGIFVGEFSFAKSRVIANWHFILLLGVHVCLGHQSGRDFNDLVIWSSKSELDQDVLHSFCLQFDYVHRILSGFLSSY